MNKDVWSYFKHFGRLRGKIYLFLTASQTDEEVPSQQGAPSACNLTYWEVFRQTYAIGQTSALRGKGGGGGKG